MSKRFKKSFTQQQPISNEGIKNAVDVLQTGRLHRYNTLENELSHTALFEQEFAQYQGAKYALACASGGYALHIALKSIGIMANEPVLTNAFTLAPVPGAIHNAQGVPILVESRPDLTIDLEHLKKQATKHQATILVLSHMRGHIGNMEALLNLCDELKIKLIEDCAHTMGAYWGTTRSGNFGQIACFSCQTYKHLNCGEGGIITSDDPQIIAKAIILSGSYMHYDRHLASPDRQYFEPYKKTTPNYSGRMDNLRAAILRVQLKELDNNCARWNRLYQIIAEKLKKVSTITLPNREEREHFVGSSIQFYLDYAKTKHVEMFIEQCHQQGVEIKWFGEANPKGYTSRYDSWHYLKQIPRLEKTDRALSRLCDLRIPLTFDEQDCLEIGEIIGDVIDNLDFR